MKILFSPLNFNLNTQPPVKSKKPLQLRDEVTFSGSCQTKSAAHGPEDFTAHGPEGPETNDTDLLMWPTTDSTGHPITAAAEKPLTETQIHDFSTALQDLNFSKIGSILERNHEPVDPKYGFLYLLGPILQRNSEISQADLAGILRPWVTKAQQEYPGNPDQDPETTGPGSRLNNRHSSTGDTLLHQAASLLLASPSPKDDENDAVANFIVDLLDAGANPDLRNHNHNRTPIDILASKTIENRVGINNSRITDLLKVLNDLNRDGDLMENSGLFLQFLQVYRTV
ncbi:MAG: hypothetical protein AAGI66_09850 [Cyanobacteria bacterium P01_H01_bin.74]